MRSTEEVEGFVMLPWPVIVFMLLRQHLRGTSPSTIPTSNLQKGQDPFCVLPLATEEQEPPTILVFEPTRLLGPLARFEASKLKVVLVEEKNKNSGIIPRTYILSHCDFTANLTLNISNVINLDQLKGWYSKDDVVAEWKEVKGDMCLHVHCYVSGPNLLLDLAAEFRYHIFSKELPLVLAAVLHGDSLLFRERPELMDALVWVYFHSSSKKYNRVECWGPLKDAAGGRIHSLLIANEESSHQRGKRGRSKSLFQALFAFLL